MHELIEAEWVSVVKNQYGGSPGDTRHYQINLSKIKMDMTGDKLTPVGVTSETETGDMGDVRRVTPVTPTGDMGVTLTVNEPSMNRNSNPGFEKFYETYPKKIGRLSALEAYDLKIQDGLSPDNIQAGAERFAKYVKLEGKLEKFLQNPENWLMGHHWEDVLPGVLEKEAPWIPPDEFYEALLRAGVRPAVCTTSLKGVSFLKENKTVVALAPNKQAATYIKTKLVSEMHVAFGHFPEIRVAA